MVAVGYAYVDPFIWPAAVVLVAGITWVLTTATKTGIGDIVERKLEPVHKRFDKQEQMIQSIDDGLADIDRRKDQEHVRLWTAIDDLRRR